MKSNHFKMRWLCLLFALFTLNIQAQITVDIKNKPLKEAIKTIERSSNYSFFYNVELEGLDKLVTVKTDNASLEETMKQLLKGTNITFQRKVDNVVVLLSKQQQAAKRSRSVSGKVVDEKGEAIIGASIIVKGSSIGTSTDVDGNFTINNISDNALLVVSSIGYKKTEVPVTNENPIEIRLNEDSNLMDEVVVVGYGVQKKINLTGSVVSVDHDVLANRPIANVTTGLQGMLPGVSIVNTTSRPGDNNSSITLACSDDQHPRYRFDRFGWRGIGAHRRRGRRHEHVEPRRYRVCIGIEGCRFLFYLWFESGQRSYSYYDA